MAHEALEEIIGRNHRQKYCAESMSWAWAAAPPPSTPTVRPFLRRRPSPVIWPSTRTIPM